MQAMSGYRKGTRKPKTMSIKEFNIGGHKVPPALLISSLLAALYALFLFGSRLEKGSDALILSVFSLISFAIFAYLSRAQSFGGLRLFATLIDAFLALSALTFIWDAAYYFNIIPGLSGLMLPAAMSAAFAALSVLLIGLLLYFEKEKPEDVFIHAERSTNLISGVIGFIVCVIIGMGVLYFMFGGSALSLDKLAYLSGMILAFSLLSAAYEEAWFRGVLLSRLEPLVDGKSSIIIQALVFGVFEAFVVYAISPLAIYLPVVFIIGSILGYYWGQMTLKDESIVGAALFHAGFYVLIGAPLFAGML